MKKNVIYIIVAILILGVLVTAVVVTNQNKEKTVDNGKFKIVTSFYPMYILTANITQGAKNIELVNMTDTNVGCIHDYTLTTSDMKKIENADAFIENGLGLEDLITKALSSNTKMKIIDASKDMINLIKEEDEVNPHVWTSLSQHIKQTQNIADALIQINPENAQVYEKNTKEYIEKLSELKLRYETELQNLSEKSAVSLNEAFEYLGKEMKLDLKTIHTDHEKNTISAETLKQIIDEMKQKNIKIILVDINDNTKNAETIAKETEATIYKLDSGLTGSLSKDAYLNSMTGNLEKLKQIQ